MSYFPELQKFLRQTHTNNLKTKDYLKKYNGLKVRVSFGQGNQSHIPWIAFLDSSNTVQKGIYPVYLYYKQKKILILAYGVSETNPPDHRWVTPDQQTIEHFFKENQLGNPRRYKDSLIFKEYDLNSELSPAQMDADLNELIDIYKNQKNNMTTPLESVKEPFSQKDFTPKAFLKAVSKAGLVYSPFLLTRFTASLLTKPFVILTGLSGSGKTKLAQSFVQWISADESQYKIIPVGADWTNREPLLGYPNALQPETYVKPDSGVLDLILNANSNPKAPYFLILDEMNLSHVERYFADFLSAMESEETIPLYSGEEVQNGVPNELKIPSNLFIIGTVNIDETTHMFSPKVLDRANTIEFRVTQLEMKDFLDEFRKVDLKNLKGHGAAMRTSFLEIANTKEITIKDNQTINDALIEFFGELQKVGAEFGYRSASEIIRLIYQLEILDPELGIDEKIDIGIIQKLLPKLHGSRRQLTDKLVSMAEFCFKDYQQPEKLEERLNEVDFFENMDREKVKYPLSLDKIGRMYHAAIANGFASFAEA